MIRKKLKNPICALSGLSQCRERTGFICNSSLEQQPFIERIMRAVTEKELESIMREILTLLPLEISNDEKNQMRLIVRKAKGLIHDRQRNYPG